MVETSPDRGITQYRHDAAGNVVQSVDARNIGVEYRYDALNRLIAAIYPSKDELQRFEYDQCQVGALCKASNGAVVTSYQYDDWGNITQQQDSIDGDLYTIGYQYDNGNRTAQISYPSGDKVHYQRDELGRVTNVNHNTQSILSDRRYRADGQFAQQMLGNGLTETRRYDAQGRLTGQAFVGDQSQLSEVDYQYDANGNVLSKQRQDYQYDAINRLISDQQNQYYYDANSNRIQLEQANNRVQLGYYSNSNQLFSVNQVTLEHDAAGNQLNDANNNRYHYNQAGKLVEVTHGEQVVAHYTYNALSQRIVKTVNGKTTHYHYDLAGQLIQESSEDSTTSYVWLDGQPIMHDNEGVQTYLISDHLNTPRIGLNQDQATTWRWESDGFGETEPANDADGNGITTNINLRFPGQYADQETGLYYNWHRYYNPNTGRYVTSDPIGLQAGVNTYGYVGGNPVGRVDFMGLDTFVIGLDVRVPTFPGSPTIDGNNEVKPRGVSVGVAISYPGINGGEFDAGLGIDE